MVTYGFANAFAKPLSQKFGAAELLFLRGIVTSAVLAAASIASYHYLQNWLAVIATLFLGVAGYIPVLAFMHGIKNSRLGIVVPIAGTAPLITVFLAFLFLNVQINLVQWIAIGLVIFANIAVSFDFKNWRQSSAFQLSSGIPFALIAALGWGLFYFFLVPSTKTLGPWLSALLVEVGVTLAAGFHVWLRSKKISLRDIFHRSIVGNGILTCLGTVAFTIGVRYYNLGIVAALANSTALISTLLGALLFKERLHIKEKIAVAIMILGIAIISFA